MRRHRPPARHTRRPCSPTGRVVDTPGNLRSRGHVEGYAAGAKAQLKRTMPIDKLNGVERNARKCIERTDTAFRHPEGPYNGAETAAPSGATRIARRPPATRRRVLVCAETPTRRNVFKRRRVDGLAQHTRETTRSGKVASRATSSPAVGVFVAIEATYSPVSFRM